MSVSPKEWSFSEAERRFEDVVEYALSDGAQFIVDADGERCVVLSRVDYDRLIGLPDQSV